MLEYPDYRYSGFLILCLIVLTPAVLSGQEKRSGAAVSIANPIHVDGVLDEPAWSSAPAISEFRQKDPHEGESSTEKTEIRILDTSKRVIVAIANPISPPAS